MKKVVVALVCGSVVGVLVLVLQPLCGGPSACARGVGASLKQLRPGTMPFDRAAAHVAVRRTRAGAVPERGRPGTDSWELRRPARAGEIAGYTGQVSALAGEPVALYVSTMAPTFRVSAYRFGWYRGGDARLVWASPEMPTMPQPDRPELVRATRTVSAGWQPSLQLATLGWPEGAYVLDLTASTGWQTQVPFFVRSRTARGRVALVAPVTTWQAYNDWGGYSLYRGPPGDRRAWAVSFDRPYESPGAQAMLFDVRGVVVRAERLGIPLAYLTDVDVDADPNALVGARAYVSMGHDEYWTPAMRDRVLAARDAGTNLVFLGANTMYWRVRLAASSTGERRLVVGYRTDAGLDPAWRTDPSAVTARFRDPPAASPESSLTGMLYECFPVDAPFRVVAPRWWGFRGTHVRAGEDFPHLVGVEADRVYPGLSPTRLQILSDVAYGCDGAETSAQSVYYTAASGAGVFNAGTLHWTCALTGRCGARAMTARTVAFTRRVTDNVLVEFARGPAGPRLPARANVARFRLPATNQVPAS